MQRRVRFERIQLLRFVAAAAVVAYHAQLTLLSYVPGSVPFPWLEYGQYGVDLFFVISGFIIVHVGTTREKKAGVFVRRRIGRIVPMYWLTTLALFALSLVPGVARSGAPSVDQLVRSLLFLSWTAGPGTYPVLNVGWTLEYEMLFYAVAAAAMSVMRRPWGWAAFVMLALVGTGRGTAFFLQNPIIVEFVLGMAIAISTLDRRLFPGVLAAALIVTATLAPVGPAWRLWAFGLPSAVIVAAAVAMDRRRGYTGRILPELGNASYSIYLVHVIVISLTCKIVARMVPTLSPALAIPFISAIAVAAGYLVHRLIERPLVGWIGRGTDVAAPEPIHRG